MMLLGRLGRSHLPDSLLGKLAGKMQDNMRDKLVGKPPANLLGKLADNLLVMLKVQAL